jgi:hypothetical protein
MRSEFQKENFAIFENGKCRPLSVSVVPRAEQAHWSLISMALKLAILRSLAAHSLWPDFVAPACRLPAERQQR